MENRKPDTGNGKLVNADQRLDILSVGRSSISGFPFPVFHFFISV
jgi:hypothetical protein